MKASFALPDAMAVGLSKLIARSDACKGFVAMKPEDNPKVFYAGLSDGNLRWYEAESEEVDTEEFMARSWVIPWSALPLSQQVMMAFAVRAWMEGQAQAFHLNRSLHA